MAAKKRIRREGDPLPAMIPSDRVLRALEEWDGITEKAFIKAYDRAANPRGRAAAELTPAQKKAIERYQESLDIEALKAALGVKTDTAAVNAIKRYKEEG